MTKRSSSNRDHANSYLVALRFCHRAFARLFEATSFVVARGLVYVAPVEIGDFDTNASS